MKWPESDSEVKADEMCLWLFTGHRECQSPSKWWWWWWPFLKRMVPLTWTLIELKEITDRKWTEKVLGRHRKVSVHSESSRHWKGNVRTVAEESVSLIACGHHHHHQSLDREGRWGTTDDFATSFLHFSLFSTALWDLPNSGPVHFLMLSSHLFLCPPCLLLGLSRAWGRVRESSETKLPFGVFFSST